MTPIFVRPVREQLEHDRLIRFLHARYKRKSDVSSNVGDQQLVAVKLGANTFFPDMVLMDGKKLAGLVEVETSESTNNLEAMAQWTHFSRARVPFHLYVPVLMVDAAKRLCDANQVSVAEIWTYRAVNDQFDLVRVFADPNAVRNGGKLAPKVILPMKITPVAPKPEPEPPPPPPVPEVKPAPKAATKSVVIKGPAAKSVVTKPVATKAVARPEPKAAAKPAPKAVAKPTKKAMPVKTPKAAKATTKAKAKPAPVKAAGKKRK